MLRALISQRRLLAFGGERRSRYPLQSSNINNYSIMRHHRPLVKFGRPSSLCRILSPFKVPNRVRENSWKSGYSMKFCALANNNSFRTYHVQLRWKGHNLIHLFHTAIFPPVMRILDPFKSNYAKNFHALSKIRCSTSFSTQLARRRINFLRPYYIRISPTINRLVCVVSLSLTRSHLVPGILSLFAGGAAGAQRTWADGKHIQTRKILSPDPHPIKAISEIFELGFRFLKLVIWFTPIIARFLVAYTRGIQFRKTLLHRLRLTLDKAGPAFVKLGQWAATRPDLFQNDLCIELAKLHSNVSPHKFPVTKATVERVFGRPISEIFEHFEEIPVASGSIAQVHRASLRIQDPKQQLRKPLEVAVKVRHPEVREQIKRDFAIINCVVKALNFIPGLSWLRLEEIVCQFDSLMMSQVDLSREAANLSRFNYNFRRKKDVSFPMPIYPFVHPEVLVETFEEGESISLYVDGLEGNARIKQDISHIGTDALLKMILVDNFVHADMHPGNILVRAPQKKRSRERFFRAKPQIVFLDVGMTAELSKSDRDNLRDFFKAVATRDGRTAAECTLRLSKKQRCPNPKAFIEELERAFTFWGTPEGDIFHPAECMHQLIDTVRRHKVNVDGYVCTVLVNILVLEGWQRKLDPDYDIMHRLKMLLLYKDSAQLSDVIYEQF